MKAVVAILLVCVPLVLVAQTDAGVSLIPQSRYDSARALHIRPFPDHFFVWPVLKQRRLDFELSDLPDKSRKLNYKSNKPFGLGLGAYLFEIAAEFTIAIPLNEKRREIYGESDARDLQLNLMAKRWGLDLYHQKYTGFYIDDPANKPPPNTPYPQRPDITTYNVGATANYVFNNKKFSFRSAYNFAEKQLRSAGSFLLVASVSQFRAEGDSAILGQQYAHDFGRESNIVAIRSTTATAAPGYTYSVILRGFFLNGTLALGPAHNWLAFTEDTGHRKKDYEFSAFVLARVALGYNGNRVFGGVSYVSQNRTAKFDNLQLTSAIGTFKVMFGYRFREIGALKKRARDLPGFFGIGS